MITITPGITISASPRGELQVSVTIQNDLPWLALGQVTFTPEQSAHIAHLVLEAQAAVEALKAAKAEAAGK